MSEWLTYERKRNALEQKWRNRVFNALQSQLKNYLNDYRQGKADADKHFLLGANTSVLSALYSNVGATFAREQYRELRSKKKATNAGNHLRRASNQPARLKFLGSINFSEDWARQVASELQLVGLNMAQNLSDTTRRKIVALLEQAQYQNLSIDQTVALILKEVTDINRRRAETITRTEVGRAANVGKMIGAKAMGIELLKVWVTAQDERVRRIPRDKADHRHLHDEAVDMEAAFSNGLSQPGDAKAPPRETVNCRCTVVFRAKEDARGRAISKQ